MGCSRLSRPVDAGKRASAVADQSAMANTEKPVEKRSIALRSTFRQVREFADALLRSLPGLPVEVVDLLFEFLIVRTVSVATPSNLGLGRVLVSEQTHIAGVFDSEWAMRELVVLPEDLMSGGWESRVVCLDSDRRAALIESYSRGHGRCRLTTVSLAPSAFGSQHELASLATDILVGTKKYRSTTPHNMSPFLPMPGSSGDGNACYSALMYYTEDGVDPWTHLETTRGAIVTWQPGTKLVVKLLPDPPSGHKIHGGRHWFQNVKVSPSGRLLFYAEAGGYYDRQTEQFTPLKLPILAIERGFLEQFVDFVSDDVLAFLHLDTGRLCLVSLAAPSSRCVEASEVSCNRLYVDRRARIVWTMTCTPNSNDKRENSSMSVRRICVCIDAEGIAWRALPALEVRWPTALPPCPKYTHYLILDDHRIVLNTFFESMVLDADNSERPLSPGPGAGSAVWR